MDGAAPDMHMSWSTQHTPRLHSSSPEMYSATPFASPAHRMLSPTWHPQMALSYMGSLHVPAVCSSVWQLLGNGEAIPDAPGVNPSVCPSMHAQASIYHLCVCLHVCLHICVPAYASVSVSICVPICASICLSICISICTSTCVSICASACTSVCTSMHLPGHLSVCASMFPPVHPGLHPPMCQSIYLPVPCCPLPLGVALPGSAICHPCTPKGLFHGPGCPHGGSSRRIYMQEWRGWLMEKTQRCNQRENCLSVLVCPRNRRI